jgi:N-methylhydantoinase B
VDDVLDLILLNCQLPREREGDFRAQFAANTLGVRRFTEICQRYGTATVASAGEQLLDYTERRTRAAIATIPDGSYAFEDWFDAPSLAEPVRLELRLSVAGDQMALDFSGCAPQGRHGFNMVGTALMATVYYAVKAVIDPTLPPNAGMYRAISVSAPEGTVVNCRAPAAVAFRSQTCQRVVDLVHGALAQAVPERVTAAHNGAVTSITFSGVDPRSGRFYSYMETIGGGLGARYTKDGLDGLHAHITNTSNLPIEALEHDYPLMVEAYELIPDSGGAGEWRGGLGVHRRIRVVGHEARFEYSASRLTTEPWGLAGGAAGRSGRLAVGSGAGSDGPSEVPKHLRPDEAVSVFTPGGGGFGPPPRRSPALVERDRAEQKITKEGAKRDYGFSSDEPMKSSNGETNDERVVPVIYAKSTQHERSGV